MRSTPGGVSCGFWSVESKRCLSNAPRDPLSCRTCITQLAGSIEGNHHELLSDFTANHSLATPFQPSM